jgi:membrane-bound lytic murein transglycosylase F
MNARSTCPARFALVAAIAMTACGDDAPPEAASSGVDLGVAFDLETAPPWAYVELGDLDQIRDRGYLRVASRVRPELEYLPRGGLPFQDERDLAHSFAAELDIEVAWVPAQTREAMLGAVRSGEADVALGRLPLDDDAPEGLAFSLPIRRSETVLARRTGVTGLSHPDSLSGRVAVQRGSFAWADVQSWEEERPGVSLVIVDDEVHPEELLHRAELGEFDGVATEREWLDVFSPYSDGLEVAFPLGPGELLAAAIRADATVFRRAIDEFLLTVLPQGGRRLVYLDDLTGIRERGTLRMLTLNGNPSYYLTRGHIRGFEHEIMRRFARSQQLRLEVIVAPSRFELIDWLLEGRGDVVAASPGPPPTQVARATGTDSYSEVEPVLVVAEESAVSAPSDLADSLVAVRAESPAEDLASRLAGLFELGVVTTTAPAARVLDDVAGGGVAAALIQDLDGLAELALRSDLRVLELDVPPGPEATSARRFWVRPSSPELAQALNEFLALSSTVQEVAALERRHFRGRFPEGEQPITEPGRISPFDPIIRQYAGRYSFDWRMIAAQMWQESRFNPQARSRQGAVGLMQVMPETARQLGFDDLNDPASNVHAGVRYLSWVRGRIKGRLEGADLLAFSLASYNAGYGHLLDARRVAAQAGLDPDRWFGNVEEGMLRLSDPEVYRSTRYGYVRGQEPVHYVRAILDRYRDYVRLVDN